ncbi:MAG: BamA/TamA family outer membrane protein [Cyanothece sp. SIO1E1]|nr:BamA/TamA family outer membrane protein [Cyanothece sp. SIO1E1]
MGEPLPLDYSDLQYRPLYFAQTLNQPGVPLPVKPLIADLSLADPDLVAKVRASPNSALPVPNLGSDIEQSDELWDALKVGVDLEQFPDLAFTLFQGTSDSLVENAQLDFAQAPDTSAPTSESDTETPPEPRVLVAEVRVVGIDGDVEALADLDALAALETIRSGNYQISDIDPELEDEIYEVVRTQPGRTTTRSQLQEDSNAVFATGFFSYIRAIPEDTPLGVRINLFVQTNPVLRTVRLRGNQLEALNYKGENTPIQGIVNDIFDDQFDQTLNLSQFQEGIKELNETYANNGFVLAQVVDAPQVERDGTVTLVVTEGVIEDIRVQFRDEDGETTDEDGNPIEGRTREFIITREFQTQPGDVFNRDLIAQDLQRVFGLGLFEDIEPTLTPGQDPRKVIVTVNVVEQNTGSIGAAAGFGSASGFFGSVSYQQQNLGGNNQTVALEFQLGTNQILFDASFTDPWIAGDPFMTSYTVNAFGRSTISLAFDGGETEVDLPSGDSPRVRRIGLGISFSRPLPGNWNVSLGGQYQNVSIRDDDGDLSPSDELGNFLAFNKSGVDDILTVRLAAVRDRRNNPLQPTRGSVLQVGTEQAIPIGGIVFNRFRGSYSHFLPTRLTRFAEGPQTFAFNVQAGTIVGNLPPFEAFTLGGSNSVRGFDEGDVATSRSFIQATAEYRFPVFSFLGAALFVDAATDFGTSDDVPGDPGGVRDKPGGGVGYGVGVRVRSPLGPIRVDFGLNNEGDSQFHFGIGERF